MSKSKKKKSIGKRILTALAIIILILIILVSGALAFGYGYVSSKLGKMQHVDLVIDDLNVSENVQTKYRNVAIFGVDSRSSNLGKGNRSDCIIIASLNEDTKEIRLISVYRDTYMLIDGYGLDKVTHAYSYGEAPLAINTLNTNLDLNITEFVTVNFDAVAEAVDALGGIDIELTSAEVGYLNSYIDETANVTGKSHARVTGPGKQTLNGVQAVAYSRIRYTEGGDYKRTERMRDVIEAMADKAKHLSVGEINDLLDQILPMVYTNISVSDILALLPDAMNYKIVDSVGWPYETRGITLDRWYGIPVTLESNVQKLHTNCFDGDYTVPDEVKEISDQIISKTGYTE